jgi:phosphoglycolate phosphatase
MAVKIVIFDMDGTLIDSQHDITVSINHVRERHHGLEPLPPQFVVDAINAPRRNLAQLFYGTEGYREADRLLFESHYHDQCVENVMLYEGIAELLDALLETDFRLSVATNAPSRFARRMLSHLDVAHRFDHIVGADMVHCPKPDREMIDVILGAYGYRAEADAAWMVGDNSKDVGAARSAGITSIFAAWGFSSHGEGDHLASTPDAVKSIIAGV